MKYIVFEGCEGTYKTTTVAALGARLRAEGKVVFESKEPGTPELPLTMALRGLMLDSQYESQMTIAARELISQAVRSINLEKRVSPLKMTSAGDYLLQDRGRMSGAIYGNACGFKGIHDINNIMMTNTKVDPEDVLPDLIVYLYRNDNLGLEIASSAKKEFANGDAMENMGKEFHDRIALAFSAWVECFDLHTPPVGRNILKIRVDGKTTEQIVDELIQAFETVQWSKES